MVDGIEINPHTLGGKPVIKPEDSEAVVRNREIIGEAAKHIPDTVKSRYPDILISPGARW
jgi:uncharacterized protein (DUF433 family)